MRPRLVVISEVLAKNAAKVSLLEHDGMVETFAANRANEPLDVAVLPRRSGRRENGFDTEVLDDSSKNCAVRCLPHELPSSAGLCRCSSSRPSLRHRAERRPVRVHVYTDVPWKAGRRVLIAAGSAPTASEPSGEVEGPWTTTDLGDLVFLPGDDKSGAIRVLVVMGVTKDPRSRLGEEDGVKGQSGAQMVDAAAIL